MSRFPPIPRAAHPEIVLRLGKSERRRLFPELHGGFRIRRRALPFEVCGGEVILRARVSHIGAPLPPENGPHGVFRESLVARGVGYGNPQNRVPVAAVRLREHYFRGGIRHGAVLVFVRGERRKTDGQRNRRGAKKSFHTRKIRRRFRRVKQICKGLAKRGKPDRARRGGRAKKLRPSRVGKRAEGRIRIRQRPCNFSPARKRRRREWKSRPPRRTPRAATKPAPWIRPKRARGFRARSKLLFPLG